MSDAAKGRLTELITGYSLSQAVYVAAKLKIADLLSDGAKSTQELAEVTKTHEPSLYRLLRALASVDVFVEKGDRVFALTPLAEYLRSDHPGSQWASAIMHGENHYHSYGKLLYSIQTGEKAFDKVYGMPVFDYFSRNPEVGKVFDAAMTSIHGRETQTMVEAYDFSRFQRLMDVGGGNGSLLIALLQQNPNLQGILYDLPQVIERARSNIQDAGLEDRCELVSGDFFQDVPEAADAYLMRHIIHDWEDEKALQILGHVRRRISDSGKLLVIESVIQPGNEPSFAKLLDLTMLLIPGGKERTAEDFEELFERAGFRLSRIVPTQSDVSIIEGEPI